MPKTNIYPHPNPDGTDASRRVEVGWQKDLGVQIGVTALVPGASPELEYVIPLGGGTATFPVTTTWTSAATSPAPQRAWDGQFVDLDREQLNRLIRTLRDARDAAFGRDE